MKRPNLQEVLGDLESFRPETPLKIQKEKIGIEADALLAAYETCLRARTSYQIGSKGHSDADEFCLSQIVDSGVKEISSGLVSQFAQAVIAYDDGDYFKSVTGIFLSALIKTSYKQGHNKFKLDLRQASPINYLGSRFLGEKRRRLNVTVDGNLGSRCWDNSIYCTAKIHGSVTDSFADKAGFSKFSVIGSAIGECFAQAYNSEIEIGGETGPYCGSYADRCTITMNGWPGWRFGAGAKNTKFRSANKEAIWKIKQHASRGCTFFLIVDGKDKLMGRK